MVKVIIFDLWLTLATKKSSIIQKLSKRFESIDYNYLIKNYEKTIQTKKWNNFNEIAKYFLISFNIPLSKENLNDAEKIFKKQYFDARVYFGVKSLLSKLKKKYKLVLLSNSDSSFENDFKKLDISKYFDHCIFSYQISYVKPDERAFKYVINLMKVNYSDCLLVDDNINNIKKVKKLGMKVYHFDNMKNLKKFFEK
jgi:HAD superfamily hydrolase (TIGR01509 family)